MEIIIKRIGDRIGDGIIFVISMIFGLVALAIPPLACGGMCYWLYRWCQEPALFLGITLYIFGKWITSAVNKRIDDQYIDITSHIDKRLGVRWRSRENLGDDDDDE